MLNQLSLLDNTENNTGIEATSIPDYWINKCWEKVGWVIFQKISNFNLNEEEIESIKLRQKDQMLKINLTYRMIKCCLEDIYPDSYLMLMEVITDKLDLFLLDLVNENNPITPEENKFANHVIADSRITTLTDRITRFLIGNVRQFPGISEILDFELLEEIFSYETADEISKKHEIWVKSETAEYSQEFFEWMRTSHRDIEDLDEKCKEKFFQGRIDSWDITKERARRELNKLKLAYGLAKWKFHGTYRDTKERYFDHLREVAEIVLNNNKNATFDQVIVAILHDIVEDTNISIRTISKLFWEKIALSVELITKKSVLEFVDTEIESHQEMKLSLENSTLINNNGLLCDRIKSRIRKIKEWGSKINFKQTKPYTQEESDKLVWLWFSSQEVIDLSKLNFLNEEYKPERNNHYFSKYRNHQEMVIQTKAIVEKRWFTLTDEEVIEASNDAIVVKLADRHHNLNTLWDEKRYNLVIRKVTETVDNLLGTSEELCIELKDAVIEDVKMMVWKLLEKRNDFNNTQENNFEILLKKIKSSKIVLCEKIAKT